MTVYILQHTISLNDTPYPGEVYKVFVSKETALKYCKDNNIDTTEFFMFEEIITY